MHRLSKRTKGSSLSNSGKAQSAMEYLMTYGWAILIISIVLAALFQLGVFNPMAYAPKAQPGSCQVYRPYGPGTTSFINLEGTCNGEIPRFVAKFTGAYSGSGFSSTSYITTPDTSLSGTNFPFTITMWVRAYPNPQTGYSWTIPFFSMQSYQAFGFLSGGNGLVLHRCNSADTEGQIPGMSSSTVFNGQWHFVAVSVKYPNYYWQFDSANVIDTNSNSYGDNGYLSIGAQYQQCDGNQFDGEIANVQVYNTSLTPAEIYAVYLEGIGGAPIKLQNLVAWYPLNGYYRARALNKNRIGAYCAHIH